MTVKIRTWVQITSMLLFMVLLSACQQEKSAPEESADTSEPVMETTDTSEPAMETTDTSEPAMEATMEAPVAKLNLNDATEEQFGTIPNVGEKMIHEFMEYRPYVSIQQFRREMGKYVSEEQIAAYEKYVYVPVDFNSCDNATLMQLPGVDEGLAVELVAERPYASREVFLDKLSSLVTDEEFAVGKTYLTAE